MSRRSSIGTGTTHLSVRARNSPHAVGRPGPDPAHEVWFMAREPQGRFLGLPYNWRKPSWADLRRAYWDRDESRVLVPKTFGWGLDINLAPLLRRRPRP